MRRIWLTAPIVALLLVAAGPSGAAVAASCSWRQVRTPASDNSFLYGVSAGPSASRRAARRPFR